MFLRPQHFQQQSIYQEWLLQRVNSLCIPHPCGVRQVALDEQALAIGTLRLDCAVALMPDGVPVDVPATDPAPPVRDLAQVSGVGAAALVYLCMPALHAFGGNSTDAGDDLVARPLRYSVDSVRAPDLFTSGLEADVSVLRHRLVLLTEAENRDGYLSLPIARIALSPSGVWQADSQYVPPLLDIHGSEILRSIVRRLLDMLLVKSRMLVARHRERSRNIAEYSTSDIASFWLLHTVNRAFPVLSHLFKSPLSHPERLYMALAELTGELLTFSSSANLTDIPAYDHDNPGPAFMQLEQLIHDLLDTVISARFAVIPLVSAGSSMFIGQLESENLLENADFYLSVESQLPTTQIIDTVPLKLKVGSPEDVEKILNSALPGVRLSHAAQTPGAIPVRIGNVYFALEPGSSIFERMKQARSICLYVPNTLMDVKIELIAVFR
jgi:type VI secretion system protein ImpJ